MNNIYVKWKVLTGLFAASSQFEMARVKTKKWITKITAVAGALLISAFMTMSHAAVIHLTDSSGNLLGAKNVLVDGALYDVTFGEGTCIRAFNDCREEIDFVFDSQSRAVSASQALLDIVFVDNEIGLFGSTPSLIAGCTSTTLGYCAAMTPFAFSFPFLDFATATIGGSATGEIGTTSALGVVFNWGTADYLTWAIWSEAIEASPVPEPGTVILFSLGIASLLLFRRRKNLN